jgi:hypothetical protein
MTSVQNLIHRKIVFCLSIGLFSFALTGFAQVKSVLEREAGEWAHIRAEKNLFQALELLQISKEDVLSAPETETCGRLKSFQIQNILKDLKEQFKKSQTQEQAKTNQRSEQLSVEKFYQERLSLFLSMAEDSPSCREHFKLTHHLSDKGQASPRFRSKTLSRVTPSFFCVVSLRYWKWQFQKLKEKSPECVLKNLQGI